MLIYSIDYIVLEYAHWLFFYYYNIDTEGKG